MINPKNKLRLCLIFVVLAAVLSGTIYYWYDEDENRDWNQATLITIVDME